VFVARDRGRAIRRLGVGVALSMVLVAVGLSIARRAFLEAIAGGLPRPVAAGFFDAVAGSMRTGFRGTFVIGLLLALLVLIAGRPDFADRWARPTQIAIGGLGVLAIVARDQPDAGYIGFVLVAIGATIAVLELVRRRRLADDGSRPTSPEAAAT
jgi:hypothetical protein